MKTTDSKNSNKIASGTLTKSVFTATGVMLLLALTACGQRGALYIPTAPEAAQRATIVDTVTAPASTETEKNNTSSTRSPMTSPASK
jgi:predicted small lipoprotein YifL